MINLKTTSRITVVQIYVAVSKVLTTFIATELTQSLLTFRANRFDFFLQWLLVATSSAIMGTLRLTEVIGKVVMTY